MSGIDFKITGMQGCIKNLRKLGDAEFSKAASEALKAAAIVLRAAVKENSSLSDHTIANLRSLDHPYAKRHGSIKIHGNKPYLVHRQNNGNMASKVTFRKMGTGRNIRYRIGYDYSAVPYARFVVAGTKVMLPRNTVYMTSQEPDVRRGMMKAVITTLGPKLRTGAGVRFV